MFKNLLFHEGIIPCIFYSVNSPFSFINCEISQKQHSKSVEPKGHFFSLSSQLPFHLEQYVARVKMNQALVWIQTFIELCSIFL